MTIRAYSQLRSYAAVAASSLLAVTACSLLAATAWAETGSTGAEYLAKIDSAESMEHSAAEMKQIITTSSGAERTLEMRSWTARGGEVQLMAYTGPARVEGDKILQLNDGDDIYYYMKRRDVTRHFARHNQRKSVMGSDFSYEDMAQGDLQEDYTATLLGRETIDNTECDKLELIPTESGPSYKKLILWAGREDHLTRRIDYYDDEGLLKTLHVSEFERFDGKKVGTRLEMLNQRENSRTVIATESMDLSVEPPEKLFTQRALPEALPR